MPKTVEGNTSEQLYKKKNQRKDQGNFKKNVKYTFKETKKLNSYITAYLQKSTSPPPKIKKKTAPWN